MKAKGEKLRERRRKEERERKHERILVVLRLVVEGGQRCEVTMCEEYGLSARAVAIRNFVFVVSTVCIRTVRMQIKAKKLGNVHIRVQRRRKKCNAKKQKVMCSLLELGAEISTKLKKEIKCVTY